ncbi:hypothetical protein M7I_8224 [Glarea lozoyensis 74030]|uniref:Uncharacterized protein n=1 Tax=Glarea lozoyensis (strain ATCC 74030 / MF5533) TaxID=1104152 RepID=H0EZF7_GLAL7|nr:hypothetical protein M7I_8224 [Glarea lozoyensis 74030]
MSPTIRFKTNVAFPVFRKGSGIPSIEKSTSEKIFIESCAEFLDQHVSGSTLGTKAQSKLIHDLNGQPMVLSIGSDQHLYLCIYVNGAVGGWLVTDINPNPAFEARVFDATKSTNGKGLIIAVSGYGSDKAKTEVWQAILECPAFDAPSHGDVNLSNIQALPWASIGASIATRTVESLVCTQLPDSRYRIVAAVNATSRLEGSYFFLDSSASQQDWKPLRLAQQVETVLSCAHGNVPKLGQGEFVLFQDASAKKETACLFQATEGGAKAIFLTALSRPISLSTSVNERGLTDLWIATEDGIGYVNHMKLGEAPERLLTGTAFSKIFAVESRTVDEASKILVYALSSHGELYIVEGSRPSADKKNVRFQASQVPIRTNIRTIAGNINPCTNASEVVFIQLTSAASLAYVNDRTYNLDQRPQTLSTDQFGRLEIVIPVSSGLGAAPIGLRFLADTSETRIFQIQPAQKVLSAISSLKTGNDLKNATSPDGRPLFPQSAKDQSQDNFDQVAQVFANVPAMITAIDPNATPDSPLAPSKLDTVIVWQKGEKGSQGDKSWLDSAVDVVGTIVGDVVEFLKTAVKGIVKLAMKIAGPVIRFILKIGVKVIRFALNTVSTVITGLANLLEGVTGINLSFITDFFKFRYKRVAETQKVLALVVESAITLSSRYLHHHRASLVDGIDIIGKFFEGLIGSPATITSSPPEDNSEGGFFSNPIISNLLKFNPLSWILEAITEELGDDFKIPSLDLNLVGQIFAALKEQFELLWGFLQRSWTEVRAAISEPDTVMEHLQNVLRDGFWTIFNAIKVIILRVFDLFLNSYDAIANFCRGTWKIPFITDLWEELADCDFTLINFVTYVAAQILELSNPKKESISAQWNLRAAFGDIEKAEMPPLLPKHWSSDDSEDVDESQKLFQQQIALTQSAQQAGKQELELNPVKEPRFGLMMTAGPAIISKPDEPTTRIEPPSQAVEIVIALARAGKKLTRSANLAVQGFSVGSVGSDSKGGSTGGGSGSIDMGSSQSTRASSFLSADGVSSSSLFDSSHLGKEPAKPTSGGEVMSVKNILIGNNTFACLCLITEQVLLYNNYEKSLRSKENFDGNSVELITSVVGLFFSFFADSPPIMAMSNFINSAGGFAATCCHPEKDAFTYVSLGASGCQAVSSIVFLVKEPTCQAIGWGGTALGFIGDITFTIRNLMNCLKRDKFQLPEIPSEEPGAQPLPETKDPKKKVKRFVSAINQAKAGVVEEKFAHLDTRFRSEPPVGDICGGTRGPLLAIVVPEPLETGYDAYRAALQYFDRRKGSVPVGEEGGINYRGTTGLLPNRIAQAWKRLLGDDVDEAAIRAEVETWLEETEEAFRTLKRSLDTEHDLRT